MERRRTLPQLARSAARRTRRLARASVSPESRRAVQRAGLRLVPPAGRVHLLSALQRAHGFQITPEAMGFVRPRLDAPGARLLVFGAGRDTPVWALLNRHGRTVVVEDNAQWATFARRNRGIEVVTVTYETTVAGSRAYTGVGDVACPTLSDDITRERWDVVIVDAPAGWGPETPGRAAPMALALALVADDGVIVIDDCFRDHEHHARGVLFDRPADAYVDLERPAALYLSDADQRRSLRARAEAGEGHARLLVAVSVEAAGPYQDALESVAGPKEPVGKELPIGADLRVDGDGLRVDIGTRTVARVDAEQSARLVPTVREQLGGRLPARGFLVDGWRDDPSRGDYRVRLWFDRRQAGPAGPVLLPEG